MFSKKFLLPAIFLFLAASSYALELHVTGTPEKNVQSSISGIVFIDMEKAFENHPMTARYREVLQNFAKGRKELLDKLSSDIKTNENKLSEIAVKINEAQNRNDQATIEEYAKQFDGVKKTIENLRSTVSETSKRTKTELAIMEEKQSLTVLKDIELVLKEVAKRHRADIVLDKQSILVGSQNNEDVTDEVITRLKGR
ncbi:OmpH family outer membrane protein [Endomicrobium proavitum]|uniref:Outer membrane protein n=1 Tax=Endomicrobium proavitum TaxID=1408281 RepID=A0A0G3WIX3_9BACT|nr:OmpH family outer membrane protein [Endomicrobium proavitum]AKL97827.1 Outer membrane protein [Endomicrobium proavitum]